MAFEKTLLFGPMQAASHYSLTKHQKDYLGWFIQREMQMQREFFAGGAECRVAYPRIQTCAALGTSIEMVDMHVRLDLEGRDRDPALAHFWRKLGWLEKELDIFGIDTGYPEEMEYARRRWGEPPIRMFLEAN